MDANRYSSKGPCGKRAARCVCASAGAGAGTGAKLAAGAWVEAWARLDMRLRWRDSTLSCCITRSAPPPDSSFARAQHALRTRHVGQVHGVVFHLAPGLQFRTVWTHYRQISSAISCIPLSFSQTISQQAKRARALAWPVVNSAVMLTSGLYALGATMFSLRQGNSCSSDHVRPKARQCSAEAHRAQRRNSMNSGS